MHYPSIQELRKLLRKVLFGFKKVAHKLQCNFNGFSGLLLKLRHGTSVIRFYNAMYEYIFIEDDHLLDLSFNGDCKCSVGYEETNSIMDPIMDLLISNLILIVGAGVETSSFIFSVAKFVVIEIKVKFFILFELLHL